MVIPTYNEAETLSAVVAGVLAALPADVLIVDDSSPDGTGVIADRLSEAHREVSAIHRPPRSGLASAYRTGFAKALAGGYQFTYQMDADGSHDPAALPAMASALRDHDLVVGSRYVEGGGTEHWPAWRRWVSQGGCFYSRALLRLPVRDTTSGFKGWRTDLLRRVDSGGGTSSGFVFQVEMTMRAVRDGARVCEVPIMFTERAHGRSKFSIKIVAEAAFRVAALAVRGEWARPG